MDPVITVTDEDTIKGQNFGPATSAITVKGTVKDGNLNLTNMTYKVNNEAEKPVNPSPLTGAGPSYNWAISSTDTIALSDANGFKEGTNTITITAYDTTSPNSRKTEKVLTFIKDTNAPNVTFTNIKGQPDAQITSDMWAVSTDRETLLGKITTIEGDAPVIRGIFEDVDSISQIGAGKLTTSTPGYNAATDSAILDKYYFEYQIYNVTSLTNGTNVSAPAWRKVGLGESTLTTQNWIIPLSGANSLYAGSPNQVIPDGLYWLDIRVYDRAGNEEIVRNIAFTVDRAPPTVTLEKDDYNIFRTAFDITGTAGDGNFRGIKVKIDNEELPFYDIPADTSNLTGTIWKLTATSNVYEYLVPASAWESIFTRSIDPLTPPVFKEGTHTITVTSYDNANKQTSETYIFVKDVTPPTVATNNITANNNSIEELNNPVIRLSINDVYSDLGKATMTLGGEDGQYYYEYRIYKASGAYANPSWIQATLGDDPGKSANPTIALTRTSNFWPPAPAASTLSELPDGDYLLDVRVQDRTGNPDGTPVPNAVTARAFTVNRKAPLLDITQTGLSDNPAVDTKYIKGTTFDGITLGGFVVDGDLNTGKVVVTLSNTAGYTSAKTLTLGADLGNYDATTNSHTLSWSLSSGEFTDLKDGLYTLTVNAEDLKENKSVEWKRTFTKDLNGPELTINNINQLAVITRTAWDQQVGQTAQLGLLKGVGATAIGSKKAAITGSFNDLVSRIGYEPDASQISDPDYPKGKYYFTYRIYNAGNLTNPPTEPNVAMQKIYFTAADPLTMAAWEIPLYNANANWASFWPGATDDDKNIPEGVWWLDITVFDRVNNEGTTTNIVFSVDYGPPKITLTGVAAEKGDKPLNGTTTGSGGNVIFNDSFKISGSVEELNFTKLLVRINNEPEAGIILAPKSVDGSTHYWEWDLANPPAGLPSFANIGANGTYTITFTAYDIGDKTDSIQYTFIKDATAPDILFNTINDVKMTLSDWNTPAIKAQRLDELTKIEDTSNASIRGSFYDEFSNIGSGTDYLPILPGNTSGTQYYFEYRIYNYATLNGSGANAWSDTNPQWTRVGIGTAPLKNVTWVVPLTSSAPAGTNYWTGSNGIPEGTYWIDVRVTDRTGNSGMAENRIFVVDKDPPTLEVSSSPEGTPKAYYGPNTAGNGTMFTLSGYAEDVNMASLQIKKGNSAAYGPTYSSDTDSTTQLTRWTFSGVTFTRGEFDAIVNDGPYTITVTAKDTANRTATKSYTFIKDSQPPQIAYSNINASVSGSQIPRSTIQEQTPEIRGTFTDVYSELGFSLDGDGNYFFRYRVGGTGNTTPAWKEMSFGTDVTKVSEGWTIPLTGAAGFWPPTPTATVLPDGQYWLEIQIYDRAGNANNASSGDVGGAPSTSLAAADRVYFNVDRNPPTMTLIAPDPAANDDKIFGTKTPLTSLGGSASDGNFQKLAIKVEGNKEDGSPYSASAEILLSTAPAGFFSTGNSIDYDWTWTLSGAPGGLPTWAELPEGNITVTVTAYDVAGKTAFQTYSFIKDTTPPRIDLNLDGPITETKPEIRLSFSDDYSRVGDAYYPSTSTYYFTYIIYKDPASKPAAQPIYLSSNPGRNVSTSIPLYVSKAFWSNADVIPDGEWYLDIVVSDRQNNKNDGSVFEYKFTVNRGAPVIDVTQKPVKEYGDVKTDPVITMKGTVTDGDLIDMVIKVNNGNGSNGNTTITLAASGAIYTNPSIAYVWDSETDKGKGIYYWTWTLSNSDYAKLGEGLNTITLTARDGLNDPVDVMFTFYKDTAPPTVKFNNINFVQTTSEFWNGATPTWTDPTTGTTYTLAQAKDRISSLDGADLQIRGSFEDASNIGQSSDALIYKYQISTAPQAARASSAITTTGWQEGSWTVDLSTVNWTINLPNDYEDGTYWLGIEVYDRAGNRYAQENIVFAIDRTPPTVDILRVNNVLLTASPAPSNTFRDAFTLTGTATDVNLKTVKVRVEGNGKSLDLTPSVGALTNGVADWTWKEIDLFDSESLKFLTNGTYTATVTATDLSGKTSVPATYTFIKDTDPPDVIWGVNTVTPLGVGASITGSFIDELSRLGASTAIGIEGDTSPNYYFDYAISKTTLDISTINWKQKKLGQTTLMSASWSIPLTGDNDLPDGRYYIYVRIADRAGNSIIYGPQEFIVERAPPLITLINPATNDLNYGAASVMTITVNGTVVDGNLATDQVFFQVNSTAQVPIRLNGTAPDGTLAGTSPNYTWKLPDNYALTSANGFVDGNNTITITAADDRGNPATPVVIKLIIDTTAPVIDVSNVTLTQINKATWQDQSEKDAALKLVTTLEGSNPAIRGVIEDPTSGIASIQYRIYRAADLINDSYQNGTTAAEGWQTYTLTETAPKTVNFTLSLSGYNDGLYWLDIIAADVSGNANKTQVKQIAFNIDRLPPGIRATTPTDLTVKNTVYEAYSKLNLIGEAWDGNFKGLVVKVDEYKEEIYDYGVTNTYNPYTGTFKTTASNPPYPAADIDGYYWSWTISQSVPRVTGGATWALLDDGTHTVTITAQDNANKATSITYTFIKDTIPPVVTLTNIGVDGTGVITEENAMIRLSINDDYSAIGQTQSSPDGGSMSGVTTLQYYFEYRIYRDGTAEASRPPMKRFGIGSPGKSVSPNIPLNVANAGFWVGDDIPDGLYWLEIEVKDRVGNTTNKMGDNPATQRTSVQFRVDRKAPVLVSTKSDDPDPNATPPDLKVFYGPTTGDPAFNLSGSVTDGDFKSLNIKVISGVANSTLGNRDDTYLAATWTSNPNNVTNGFTATAATADFEYGWSWNFSLEMFKALADGINHTITITAEDDRGRKSSKTYTFTKDTGKPELRITSFNAVKSVTPTDWATAGGNQTAQANLLSGGGSITTTQAAIRGTFIDPVSAIGFEKDIVDGRNQYYFEYRIYTKTQFTTTTLPNYEKYGLGEDQQSLSVSWDIPLYNTGKFGNPPLIPLNGDIEPGQYWLDIKVGDRSGNEGEITYIVFSVNRGDPGVTIDPIIPIFDPYPKNGTDKFFNDTFTIKGSINDTTIDKVTIKLDDGSEVQFNSGSFSEQGTTYYWEWNVKDAYTPTAPQSGFGGTLKSFEEMGEGSHTITITAYSLSGKTKSALYTFTKDTVAPQITLGNLNDVTSPNSTVPNGITSIEDTATRLRGSFYDNDSFLGYDMYPLNSGNYIYEYRIYSASQVAGKDSTNLVTWLQPALGNNATKSISWEIDLPDNDGTYWFDIRIKDRIGNTATKENVVFTVDRAPPTLVITSPTVPVENYIFGVQPAGVALTLSGTASDVNIKEVKFKVNDANESNATTFVPGDPDSTTQIVTAAWTKTFTWADLQTYFTEGQTTKITVTAYDNSNKQSVSQERFYTKDTTMPEMTLLNLDSSKDTNFDQETLRIQGVASDTVGVYQIWTKIEKFTNPNATYPQGRWDAVLDETVWTNAKDEIETGAAVIRDAATSYTLLRQAVRLAGSTSTLNPTLGTTVNWTKRIGAGANELNLGAGRYRLTVRVVDRAQAAANESYNGKPLASFVTGTDEAEFVIDTSTPTISLNSTPQFVNGKNHIDTPEYKHPFYTASDPLPTTAGYAANAPGFYITGTALSPRVGMRRVYVTLQEDSVDLVTGLSLEDQPPGAAKVAYNATLKYPLTDRTQTWYTENAPEGQGPFKWGILVPSQWTTLAGTTASLQHGHTYTVNVVAVSWTGKISNRTRDFTYDTEAPTVEIILPQWMEQITGTYTVRGMTSDDNGVKMVEYQIGKQARTNNQWLTAGLGTNEQKADNFGGGLYSWTYELNASSNSPWTNLTYADSVRVNETGNLVGTVTFDPNNVSNIWQLPFRLRITDSAGNQYINDITDKDGSLDEHGNPKPNYKPGQENNGQNYFILLDPDADIPKVTITSPTQGSVVGGQVRITGSAQDNDWIYAVMVRVYRGKGANRVLVNYPLTGAQAVPGDTRRTNEDGWGMATFTSAGPSVIWNYTINMTDEFNTTDGTSQDIYIEATAVDSKSFQTYTGVVNPSPGTVLVPPTLAQMNAWDIKQNRKGNNVGCEFVIDSTLPQITNIQIKRANDPAPVNYENSIRTAGTFTIYADVTGAQAISRVQWRSAGLSEPNYITMMTITKDNATGAVTADTTLPREDLIGTSHPQWGYTLGAPTLEVTLKNGAAGAANSGLVSGTTYTINNVAGNVNWDSIGVPAGTTPAKGTVFTYNGTAVTGVPTGVNDPKPSVTYSALISASAMTAGKKYMIVEPGSVNWTAIGASSNTKYTVFVYNNVAITSGGTGTVYTARGDAIGSPYEMEKAFGQRFYYPVTITANTTTAFPVFGTETKPSSGALSLDLMAEYFNTYRAQTNMNYQVDNYYPTGEYTAPRNASTEGYWVNGTAVDIGTNSGPIGGVKEVLAFFKKKGANTYYRPDGAEWSSTNGGATGVPGYYIMEGMDTRAQAALKATYSPYPNMTVNPPQAVRIDNQEITGDSDGDGYIEEWSVSGGIVTWGFQFNTTKFPDGPIELHYIVVDQAGNGTHYMKELYIRNNPPIISSIILKTDLAYTHWSPDADTNQPGGARKELEDLSIDNTMGSRKKVETYFKAKNYRLGFVVNTIDGNGTKNFRVRPVNQGDLIPATSMTPGEVYTIVAKGTTNWDLAGAPSGTTKNVSAANAAGITFVCTDTPTAGDGTVYGYTLINNSTARDKSGTDTGSTASVSVTFGNRNDWRADPAVWDANNGGDTDFGQNAARINDSAVNGGLFLVEVWDSTVSGGAKEQQQSDVVLVALTINNRDTTPPVTLIEPFHWNSITDNSTYIDTTKPTKVEELNGHIELEKDVTAEMNSAYTSANSGNPKVSGSISIRGTVEDNNVLKSIEASLEGFDLGNGVGNYVDIATYTATGDVKLNGVDSWSAKGWKSTITRWDEDDAAGDLAISQNGHRVRFQLDIDTSKLNNVVDLNRALRIRSRDQSMLDSSNETVSNNQTANTLVHNKTTVNLINGNRYRINEPGNVEWTKIGSSSNAKGMVFTYNGAELVDGKRTGSVEAVLTLTDTNNGGMTNGSIYRIYEPGNVDWMTIGAGNDAKDTVFVYNNATLANGKRTGSVVVVTKTNRYKMDIVPYISEISTQLGGALRTTPSAYGRSATGAYPVRGGANGETITIKGFNLTGASRAVRVVTTKTATTGGAALTTTETSGTIQGTIGSDVDSGYLVMTFGTSSIRTVNNINDTTAPYNQEPNGLNNNTLVNDRYLYVWNIGVISNIVGSSVLHPIMRVNDNGDRMLAFGFYSGAQNGRIYVMRNNTAMSAMPGQSNRVRNTGLGIGRTNNSWYALGSDQSSAENRGFALGFSTPAGTASAINDNTYRDYANGYRYIGIVPSLHTSGTDRFVLPRIAVRPTTANGGTGDRTDGNADRVLISYFDNEGGTTVSNNLYVIYGSMGNTPAPGTQNDTHYEGIYHARDDNNSANNQVNRDATVVAKDTETHAASIYSAVGFLDNGLPLIAWYDNLNQELLLSWTEAPTATAYNNTNSRKQGTTADWQGNAKLIETLKGNYVDMAVDAGNNIHLAYYDVGSSGLWYTLIPPTGSGTAMRPDVAARKTVKVDTYLSAGMNLMINVRSDGTNYVPYISYAHGSFLNTKYSSRVAWRKDFTSATFEGSDENDRLTGKWEVMTVPTNNIPKRDEFVCNGVPTANNWVTPVEFINGNGTPTPNNSTSYTGFGQGTSGTALNAIVYPLATNSVPRLIKDSTTNIADSIVVGYMTGNFYEGAMIKGNIKTPWK